MGVLKISIYGLSSPDFIGLLLLQQYYSYLSNIISTASNMKYSSNGGASEDSRQPMPPGTRPKEPRYVKTTK